MSTKQTPAIEFRNVSIWFDDVQALQKVSFSLPQDDMICITGDSGSGKSVLLLMLPIPGSKISRPESPEDCNNTGKIN